MNDIINSFEPKRLQPRDARLWVEWKGLNELCSKRKAQSSNPQEPSISYIIRKRNAIGLPTEYEIWYRVRSIVGVEDTPPPRKPKFGNLHKMNIVLPNNYPSADGNPEFSFRTDVWHPNIRYSGNFKGRVCLTIKEMGVMASLKTLVLRVERYLKYQQFHAENTYPYPEDQYVAEWVREEAIPNGWTRFSQTETDDTVPSPPQPTQPTETPTPIEPPEPIIFSI